MKRSYTDGNKRKREHFELLESRRHLSASSSEIIEPSLTIQPATTATTAAAATTTGPAIYGYTPQQIKSAYGLGAISFNGVSGTGAGQTIAIVDAFSDPNIASDLSVFDSKFNLAAPPSFTQVAASTGSTTKLPAVNAGWDGEIALDVEWAHAIAPQANIVLVDAASDSLTNLMSAVTYARSLANVSVVSMSWGGSEFNGENSFDKNFTTPAGHIGITFVAASGDEGAAAGAEYPASSPNVLSVGGTTLTLSSTNTISSESAWSDSTGGVSVFEPAPTYQAGVSSKGRSTPDVSYDANPSTGFPVYDSIADEGYVGWEEVGGTSAGAPQWAALIAIADQGRVKAGLGTLDGATGTLPALYGFHSNASTYSADFNDITTGSSPLSGGGFGGFGGPFGGHGASASSVSATTGYDTLTGLGTPKGASLISALVSYGSKPVTAAPTGTTTGTTTTGTTSTGTTSTGTTTTKTGSATPTGTSTKGKSTRAAHPGRFARPAIKLFEAEAANAPAFGVQRQTASAIVTNPAGVAAELDYAVALSGTPGPNAQAQVEAVHGIGEGSPFYQPRAAAESILAVEDSAIAPAVRLAVHDESGATIAAFSDVPIVALAEGGRKAADAGLGLGGRKTGGWAQEVSLAAEAILLGYFYANRQRQEKAREDAAQQMM